MGWLVEELLQLLETKSMEKKIKVLFVTQNILHHYRVPVFQLVNKNPNIELTLAHCGGAKVQNDIPEILLKLKKHGPFYTIKNFDSICKDYDVVLCMFYYNNLSFLKSIVRKKQKIILWSIGVPASYNRLYGEASNMRYKILSFFQSKADALLFYSNAPLDVYRKRGIEIDERKVFIANNTVEVIKQPIEKESKNTLLFIGTLYLEKGLQLLLDAYKVAYSKKQDILPLNIVGGGEQFETVNNWIKNNGLEDKINMLGAIYDSTEKAEIFKKAIACISPMQAGLSVLESMGYGVPFITSHDAITGGEAFNIIDGENGLRMKDISQLKNVILDINQNKGKFLEMGEKAYEYYWHNRTINIMANGIVSAIEYSYQN
jgi:glycosyltransferase involved in cell wall biosynthesis